MTEQPRMYTDLADWWPILSQPADYEEEAAIFTRTIQSMLPGARTMLELGSGGGNNASFLKQHFDLTLVDRSPAMLAVSQRLNPGILHMEGDMRTFRMEKTFDVVFIHDAIMYMTSEEDLRQAIQTAAAHTRPGGMVLLVPDCVKESFHESTDHGGHDGRDVAKTIPNPDPALSRRSMRYLEWSYDPDPTDTTITTDFVFLLREEPDRVETVYDRHIDGLFPRATWLRLLEEAGLQPQALPFDHSEVEAGYTTMFAGLKR